MACLDFFLLGLGCHLVILHLLIMALMSRPAAARDTTATGLRDILLQIDPEALSDNTHGFI